MTLRPVLLTWLDSCIDSPWQEESEPSLAKIRSIGWLLAQTDQLITIAQSFDDDNNTAERLTIPRSCVLDVTYLQ